jgi:L-threonylcarbamoyladenylate synthase
MRNRVPSASRALSSALLRKLRAHLRQGGVVAYATESCFGLGCDPRNYRAVRKILKLKGRPQNKGLILIGADFRQLAPFVAPLTQQEIGSLANYWPGPTTLLLPAARRAPKWLTGGHASIALRVTAHPDAAWLCKQLGMALVSTSANRAGNKPYKTHAACRKAFGASVLVLPGRIGKRKRPSTIMDFKSGRILRQ